ncbi:MAG: hypothetical protein E7311_04435 [Clostridiales bacterium]|nr:hypothetical protein [Clostridiales bacterium]
MEKYEKGYHITKKDNLPGILKNGLKPRIGRKSNSVNEHEKLLCFFTDIRAVNAWKERLYKDEPFDELAILSFELNDMQYEKRIDSVGDFFTKDTVLPEKINVVEIVKKREAINVNSFESQYEIIENKITQQCIDRKNNINEKKEKIINELAAYEHKKWSEYQSRIHWQGNKRQDGSIEISEIDIADIERYNKLDFENIGEIDKKELREKVLETFYIMQDNNMLDNLEIPDEDFLRILAKVEYTRMNKWYKYMLSVCKRSEGKYIIPADKVDLWENAISTPYQELSDKQKQSDKIEVDNIFIEIQRYKIIEKNNDNLDDEDIEI